MSELGEQFPAETEYSETLHSPIYESREQSLAKHIQFLSNGLTESQARELTKPQDVYEILRKALRQPIESIPLAPEMDSPNPYIDSDTERCFGEFTSKVYLRAHEILPDNSWEQIRIFVWQLTGEASGYMEPSFPEDRFLQAMSSLNDLETAIKEGF